MKYLLLIFMWIPGLLFAQKIEMFGYFEPQLLLQRFGNSTFQLSSNKLRVDLQLNASKHVSFGANLNYISYHGKTEWNILDFLPSTIKAEVPDFTFQGAEINPYVLRYENKNILDNAYLRLSLKSVDFTIGKQQLSLGTGYVFNPTDVFNKKDLIDPTYEQPGHNAFRMDMSIKGNWGIAALYFPADNWKTSDLLFKIKGYLDHFDFSLIAIRKQWSYTDARLFNTVQMNFSSLKTNRQILGGDFAGELLGLGVWGEYAYNQVNLNDNDKRNYFDDFYNNPFLESIPDNPEPMSIPNEFYELVLGVDYTFDFQTYIMCEFYRNTLAKSDDKKYLFNDWMQFLFAETKSITQNQIYLDLQHPLTDLLNIGCSTITSLSDNSTGFIPTLTYNIYENVELIFIGNIYSGKTGTAYAKNLGNGAIIRARLYF